MSEWINVVTGMLKSHEYALWFLAGWNTVLTVAVLAMHEKRRKEALAAAKEEAK
jgi:hypothetical protein